MISKKLKSFKAGAALTAVLSASLLCSCNPIIFDDLPECIPDYRLRLSYVHNMDFAEKVSQVEAAEVYAFDKEGNIASISRADRQTLLENDWTMTLDLEQNVEYDLVIWGGLTEDSPFMLDGARSFASFADLTCRLNVENDGKGNPTSDRRFPGLFHGMKTVTYTREEGSEEMTAELVKDTNILDVVMKRSSGVTIDSHEYEIKVIDANGVINHDNSVSGEAIHYLPTDFTYGVKAEPDGKGGLSDSGSEVLTARLHLARLMENSDARLVVADAETGVTVWEYPLVELLLEAKNLIAPDMNSQEYLDRQDEYTVWITLPSDDKWFNVTIYVNNWVIVNNFVDWH